MTTLRIAAAAVGLDPSEWVSVVGFGKRHYSHEYALSVARQNTVKVLKELTRVGMSLRRLAVRLKVSPTYLSLVMNGKSLASHTLIERVGEMIVGFREARPCPHK